MISFIQSSFGLKHYGEFFRNTPNKKCWTHAVCSEVSPLLTMNSFQKTIKNWSQKFEISAKRFHFWSFWTLSGPRTVSCFHMQFPQKHNSYKPIYPYKKLEESDKIICQIYFAIYPKVWKKWFLDLLSIEYLWNKNFWTHVLFTKTRLTVLPELLEPKEMNKTLKQRNRKYDSSNWR